MDEPASALDPIATQRIEGADVPAKTHYTIVIVTHNMQQAARVSDRTAFFWLGRLIEYAPPTGFVTTPTKADVRYVTGRSVAAPGSSAVTCHPHRPARLETPEPEVRCRQYGRRRAPAPSPVRIATMPERAVPHFQDELDSAQDTTARDGRPR
jgi:ABC-type proline/glycine betaine transport system ATPase subunit